MRHFLFCILTILIITISNSCRKERAYAPSAGNLEFSKDTVYLDTLFANIGSSTRTLKIYNRNRDDVEIPLIRLAKGQESKYRLNVDGVAGKAFTNVPIFAQDSIFVFIETTVTTDAVSDTEFLYTDIIQFDTADDLQEVHLVSLVKDAVFIYPKTLADGTKETVTLSSNADDTEITIAGSELQSDQLQFTNDKPYVIYGHAVVPPGEELLINAGARVHFHKNSGLYVSPGAKLTVAGALSEDQELLENEVIFESDRLENEFATIPGQWGSVWIASGSTLNTINHLTIKNATIGLRVDGDGLLENSTLAIQNTQIYNSASVNLWAKTAFLTAENLVLGGSGNSSLNCNLGGNYAFTHCTIANYWSHGFRSGAAVAIDNGNNNQGEDLINAVFTNCIIDGSSFVEIALTTNETNDFNYSFQNCMLKFKDDANQFANNPLFDFQNTTRYNTLYLNLDPHFLNAFENDFNIEISSEALGKGNLDAAQSVPVDILGNSRLVSPAIGAYQTSQ